MKHLIVELRGFAKDIVQFMNDNLNFVTSSENGLTFTSELLFGNIVNQADDISMQQMYGTDARVNCHQVNVEIYKNMDRYEEELNDDRPVDLYKFSIVDNGFGVSIKKKFIQGQYFRDDTFVSDRMQFMCDFFKYYSGIQSYEIKEKRKLDDYAQIELKVMVHELPVDLLELWKEKYQVSTGVLCIDGNEGYYQEYFRHPMDKTEEPKIKTVNANDEPFLYLKALLEQDLADTYKMGDMLCHMLYDIKDKVPYDIQLEYDAERNHFKYNKAYADITHLVYSLARNDKVQLAKIYVSLCKIYDNIAGKELDDVNLCKQDRFVGDVF